MTGVELLGWVLIHSLWELALVGLLFGLGLAVIRRPEMRYAWAVSALLMSVVLPVGTGLWLAHPHAEEVVVVAEKPEATAPAYWAPTKFHVSASNLESVEKAPSTPETLTWPCRIALAWLVGAGLMGFRFGGGVLLLWRKLRFAVMAPPEWSAWLKTRSAGMGLRRPIRLLTSSQIDSPIVFGLFRATILFPVGLMTKLTPDQVEALLLHELAHLRRHDFLVNVLQSLAESVLFFHPVVWWIGWTLRNERELCCDDIAAHEAGSRLSYARALVSLEAYRLSVPYPALGANGGSLMYRVRRMTQPTPSANSRGFAWVPALAGTSALLGLAGGVVHLRHRQVAPAPPPPVIAPTPKPPVAPPPPTTHKLMAKPSAVRSRYPVVLAFKPSALQGPGVVPKPPRPPIPPIPIPMPPVPVPPIPVPPPPDAQGAPQAAREPLPISGPGTPPAEGVAPMPAPPLPSSERLGPMQATPRPVPIAPTVVRPRPPVPAPRVTITGRVLSRDGQPVSGAKITDGFSDLNSPLCLTQSDGSFRIRAYAPPMGTPYLWAVKGNDVSSAPTEVVGGKAILRLDRHGLVKVMGRTVDSFDHPLAGVKVKVEGYNVFTKGSGRYAVEVCQLGWTTSDKEGRFQFLTIPTSQVGVAAYVNGIRRSNQTKNVTSQPAVIFESVHLEQVTPAASVIWKASPTKKAIHSRWLAADRKIALTFRPTGRVTLGRPTIGGITPSPIPLRLNFVVENAATVRIVHWKPDPSNNRGR